MASTHPDTDTHEHPDSHGDAHAHADQHTHRHAHSDADAHTHRDRDGNLHSDRDADGYPYAHTDLDTNQHSDAHAYCDALPALPPSGYQRLGSVECKKRHAERAAHRFNSEISTNTRAPSTPGGGS
jgi:hypothetical protein